MVKTTVSASAVVVVVLAVLHHAIGCPTVIGNCQVFQPTDEWNRPIDTDPVDYQNSCIDVMSGTTPLRLDLGTDVTEAYGMLYNIFNVTSPCMTPMIYGLDSNPDDADYYYPDYQSESEWFTVSGTVATVTSVGPPWTPAYFPFPQTCLIEGGTPAAPDPTSGDRHVLVLDAVNCYLYESWHSNRYETGWRLANTAIWDLLQGNQQRPVQYTSADAAGLPIFPGVLRYSEVQTAVATGTMVIPHALRFTASAAQMAFANPGRHAGPQKDTTKPWYGSRYRLNSAFSESGYSNDTIVLIRTLKKYGLIFADQGSDGYITCENNPGFANSMQDEINSGSKRIPWSQFTLVQPNGPIIAGDDWSGRTPLSCNGQTQNSNPTWTPVWNPTCPSPAGPANRALSPQLCTTCLHSPPLGSQYSIGNCSGTPLLTGTFCKLGCAAGLTLSSGSLFVECVNSTWTTPTAVCSSASGSNPCAAPIPSGNHTIGNCTSLTVSGGSCTLGCASGHTISSTGSDKITCTNGVWSSPTATCNPNCASLFTLPANTVANTCTTNYASGHTCAVACSGANVLTSGSLTATCSTSGSWTTPTAVCSSASGSNPCAAPIPSGNHTIGNCTSLTVSGGSCTLGCASGFTVSSTGSDTITCTNGVWSTPTATCNPNCASLFSLPSNVTAGTCTANFPSGSTCQVACVNGNTLESGSLTATCQSTGVWTSPTAVCVYPLSDFSPSSETTPSPASAPTSDYSPTPASELPCSYPAVSGGQTTGNCSSVAMSGSACVLGCNAQYTISPTGSNEITCTNGDWSAATATCDANCAKLPKLTNSAAGTCKTNQASGSTCTLGCASGYAADGSLAVKCSKDTWSTPSGSCKKSKKSAADGTSGSGPKKGNNSNTGLIAGVVVAGAVVVGAAAALFHRRRTGKQGDPTSNPMYDMGQPAGTA